jgi:hypothetical protein
MRNACSVVPIQQSWLGAYAKLQPMVVELFRKMPQDVAQTALAKLRNFAMAVTEPQQASDALHVVSSAARRCPEAAERLLLQPLLRMIEEDAASLQGADSSHSGCARQSRYTCCRVFSSASVKGS